MSEPRVLYIAPLKDFSGYADASRNYVHALDIVGMNLVTRDLTYDGGNFPRSDRQKELASGLAQGVDIIVQQTTPNETEYKEGCFNINAFCWETDRVPQQWVNMLNQMDLILVPIEANRIVAQECGVVKPIEVVPYSCDLNKYKNPPEPFVLPGADDSFKFLAICQYSKKKGIDALLKAYFTEFTDRDPVVLILKIYMGPNDGQDEKTKIIGIINAMKGILRLNNYPPVKLIHNVMSHAEIERLYVSADCYVLPSRGEGWGIPHFDALGYGLPTIATKGTGPEAFITKDCGWLVDSHWSPVCSMSHPHDFMYTGLDNWREPDVCSLKDSMREAFKLYGLTRSKTRSSNKWNEMGIAAKKRVEDFSPEKIGPQLRDIIMQYYAQWRKINPCS